MNEEDEFLGCISCMSSSNLFDLFSVYEDNGETYASMFKTCFAISLPQNVKFLCSDCAEQLEKAFSFKEQTSKSLAMLKEALAQDEEYLDEKILEEDEPKQDSNKVVDCDDKTEECNEGSEDVRARSEKIYEEDESKLEDMEEDGDTDDKNEDDLNEDNEEDVDDPQYNAPPQLKECDLCGVSVAQLEQHQSRCHGAKAELDNRKYPCHFCENVYISKKACFTHLRMKHGLKLCTEQTTKFVMRERKKCHLCSRDFSQKQILNKHLWKAHGLEVEKRKAFVCPLCSERVSYGAHFSAHLLHAHRVHEHVEQLHFHNMDDFLLFKSAVQEETKFRYRKTTASKQTIEGVRSHYMCSQSGVYVYQGKGKRPAPERQIYKTGKACPAHMIVTEKLDHVLVTFYKTHVGHGPCPYFEPRELKKPKIEASTSFIMPEDDPQGTLEEGVICDACGLVCADADTFRSHAHTHNIHTYTCQYCTHDFQDIQAWTYHMRVDHNMAIF